MNYQRLYGFRSPGLRRWAPLALGLALAGCAGLPAQDPAPQMRAAAQADFARTADGQWPAATWWQDLGDSQLDTLIRQALKDSPSVAVVLARVQQARAEAGVASANTGLKLDANGSVSRTRFSANGLYPPPIAGSTRNDGELSLNFSYDFDFWGRNRSALQAALGRESASEAEAAGAASSLSAAIASGYFHWQALNQRVSLEQGIVDSQQRLVDLEARRAKAGLSSGGQLAPLRAEAAIPQQTLVQLQAQRDQALFQLKALVASGAEFPELKPQPLPVLEGGLPANLSLDLAARRADVTAARERVEASVQDVKSARAAFYPDVSISALAGLSSLDLGKLFQSNSIQAGVTPAIHLPLFDAGRLRAGLESQRASATLAVAQYDQAVQNAVNEINDAAVRAQGAEQEAAPLQRQREARLRDLDNNEKLLHAGLADGRVVQRSRIALQALDDQELARQERALLAHIDLIKALGGGYQSAASDNTANR